MLVAVGGAKTRKPHGRILVHGNCHSLLPSDIHVNKFVPSVGFDSAQEYSGTKLNPGGEAEYPCRPFLVNRMWFVSLLGPWRMDPVILKHGTYLGC